MHPVFNGRILVVDDEPMIHDVMRESLATFQKSDGTADAFRFSIDCVFRGLSALEMVAESVASGTPYASVFLDIRMPGIDGVETALRLREIDANIEIVFMTGHDSVTALEVSENIGRDVLFLRKPFHIDEIRQAAVRTVFSWNRNRLLEGVVGALSELSLADRNADAFIGNVAGVISRFHSNASILIGVVNGHEMRVLHSSGSFLFDAERLALFEAARAAKPGLQALDERVWMVRDRWILALRREGRSLRKDERFTIDILFRNTLLSLENFFLRTSLVEKERLSVMGDAVRMVVHDLKTPLTAIHGLAELASATSADAQRPQLINHLISRAARNGISLISDILSYSDSKPIEREPTPVAALFEEVQRAMEPYLVLSSMDLEFEAPPAAASLDKKRMVRVLVNLVRNACDAIELSENPSGHVKVGASVTGKDLTLWVEDNGPGMPPEMVRHLFEGFSPVHHAGGGIGLAICRNFVEMHGGHVEVKSTRGDTRFTIVLPECLVLP